LTTGALAKVVSRTREGGHSARDPHQVFHARNFTTVRATQYSCLLRLVAP
jgi:hypothetical protein